MSERLVSDIYKPPKNAGLPAKVISDLLGNVNIKLTQDKGFCVDKNPVL